jgi:hypothetical protein
MEKFPAGAALFIDEEQGAPAVVAREPGHHDQFCRLYQGGFGQVDQLPIMLVDQLVVYGAKVILNCNVTALEGGVQIAAQFLAQKISGIGPHPVFAVLDHQPIHFFHGHFLQGPVQGLRLQADEGIEVAYGIEDQLPGLAGE